MSSRNMLLCQYDLTCLGGINYRLIAFVNNESFHCSPRRKTPGFKIDGAQHVNCVAETQLTIWTFVLFPHIDVAYIVKIAHTYYIVYDMAPGALATQGPVSI